MFLFFFKIHIHLYNFFCLFSCLNQQEDPYKQNFDLLASTSELQSQAKTHLFTHKFTYSLTRSVIVEFEIDFKSA